MRRRTDILTHLLLLLLILVACTADDAIKENLSHQDEYVTVRMHIPGMKAVATRAAETDNITSIVALVFRSNQLISVTEYSTTNSALHPISPISGTITIDKPDNGDVIHFLANLPANYSEGVTYVDYLKGFITNQNKTQEDVLRNLSSRDYSKLSYWGMATRNENNAVMDVILYRNKAMIEIKPGADCTFRQDELFIAGLDNPNNVGLLVPYNGGFNFDLDNNDYLTLPQNPDPLDKTDELTNYGAGYDNAYYVFEHANPNDAATGLYVICKIGDDYYKVALHDEKGQPYHIIRNHKYTILVNDLDAGCETYSEALSADPIKPTVIETKDVTINYIDNPIIYLNGGASSTLPVYVTIPAGASLTQFSIETYNNFDVTASDGTLTATGNGYTYVGGSTTFTFIPKNGLSANNYTILLSGSGNNLNDFSRSIDVKVDATMMSVVAKNSDSEINMDNSETSATLVLTKPGNVSNVNVSVSSDVFNYSVNGNEYTFTPKNNNIASGSYTVTFSDANYSDKVNCSATITVVNTPSLTISPTSAILNLNDDTPKFEVTATVPQVSTLASLVIAAPEYITIKQSGTTLGTGEVTYSTQINGGNSVTFTFELTEGATIPNGVNSFNVNFTGSGTNLKVNSSVNVSVSNETTSSVNLEITSPSQAHATIDLGSYNAWEDKSITMQLRIPAGVKQVTFGGESINNFTISTYSGDFKNNVYTNSNSSSSQEVTFTIEIGANASLGEHIINISGTGDGITVNGTQMVMTITQTVFGVTPTTTEISNTNSYVDLTIVKPKALTQLCFVISDNNMLMATATGNEDHNFQCNNNIYYFYNSSNTMEEVIRIKLRDDKTITEEKECTISFYEGTNPSGSAKTVTITLKP